MEEGPGLRSEDLHLLALPGLAVHDPQCRSDARGGQSSRVAVGQQGSVRGEFARTVAPDGVAGGSVLVIHGVRLSEGESPDLRHGCAGRCPVAYSVDGMGQVHRGGSGVPNPVDCPVENLESFGKGLSCRLVESDHQAVSPTGSDGWSTPYRESRDGVDDLVDRTQPDYP